jgi:hypothetical protein
MIFKTKQNTALRWSNLSWLEDVRKKTSFLKYWIGFISIHRKTRSKEVSFQRLI